MRPAISVGPVAASRSPRAVGSNHVVRASVGAESIGGPDRKRRRLVPRRMNPSVDFRVRRILAVIARGSYDNYAGVNQAAHRAAYRVVLVRVDGRHSQANVD